MNQSLPAGIKRTRVTADAAITGSPGKLWGVVIQPAAAESYIILYDDTDAATAANEVMTVAAAAGTAKGVTNSVILTKPLDFTDLYANIEGASAVAYVYWEAKKI